ncbi:MAG: penicillin-binding protein 2 [Armatimonadetes bacterium]|nr:penicillin-binding protein 2 [Armatimonadota bacterium]MDE2207008.1 penicillin-binding protein 2 [Armatimonadota bacterium]
MIESPDQLPDLRRLIAMCAVIAVVVFAIIARLWYLQIVLGSSLASASDSQRTRLIRRTAARGIIEDRAGNILATSKPRYVVSLLPNEVHANSLVLPRIAALIGVPVSDIVQKIAQNRTTPFDPVPIAVGVDMHVITRVEEQKLDLPGVLITRDPIRYYPQGALCAHIIGLTRPISAARLAELRPKGYRGGDYVGLTGLEESYESDLRGTSGGLVVAVDANGRLQRDLGETPSAAGHTLVLNLDLNLQKAAEQGLNTALQEGHPGAAVALDCSTGGVLAMVSTPSFDPNTYGHDYSQLLANPQHPLINRATDSHYPPGSTFKLVTAAAGFASGTTSPSTGDYCSGSITVGKRVFHCDKRSGHGALAFVKALGVSCDVYFWHVAMRAGTAALLDAAHRYGLAQPTGIDLPASVDDRGNVPSPDWKRKHKLGPWLPGDLLNMAIGQGYVGVTPLQLADYTAAVANGGSLMVPHLVSEVLDDSSGTARVVRTLSPAVRSHLGLTPDQRDAIVSGMIECLGKGGTAENCGISGLTWAGKTGSAQVFIHGRKATTSVFVCFAPAWQPRIAIAVLVEGGGYGADTAAPIARQMVAEYLHIKLHHQVAIGPRPGH